MSSRLIKLNNDEVANLTKIFQKSKKEATLTVAGTAILLFIFSIIPSGLANFISRTSTGTNNQDDPAKSLVQLWGLGTWLIVFIITIAVLALLIFRSRKISLLKKDLQEREKMEVDVEIANKFADDKAGFYFMRVNGDTWKNKKITLERAQFNEFTTGQKLTIDVYKNSMLLVSNRMEVAANLPADR